MSSGARAKALGACLILVVGLAQSSAAPRPDARALYGMPDWGLGLGSPLLRGPSNALRGVTLGPIESRLQPGRGYGSASYQTTLREVKDLGANWVSLTVFGRVYDLKSSSVSLDFEAPVEETLENLTAATEEAHRAGLKVMLVPHLWVESGEWRAELAPPDEAAWTRFESSYSRYVKLWAKWAEDNAVDLFSAGVELRFWVTTTKAPSFVTLLRELREIYHGSITYASNWDDADDTEIWRSVDLIGINGFYPLHWERNASDEQIARGAMEAARRVREMVRRQEKPVFFNEFGYTARQDSLVEPWLWPEQLRSVETRYDEQARGYAALLGETQGIEGFYGAFVWRMYADVADLSQEPNWGFSPWGKPAESVLRSAYGNRFAVERLPPALEDARTRHLLERSH